MKIRLSNPQFEEFQTVLGVCYLFLYGFPKLQMEKQIPSVDKGEIFNKADTTITPAKINNLFKIQEDLSTSKKTSIKSDSNNNNNEEKLPIELVGLNDQEKNRKNLFKDRNTKDEKYFGFRKNLKFFYLLGSIPLITYQIEIF